MTTEPRIVVQSQVLKERVPDALLRPCPKPWSKAGGPRTTEDFVNRGDVNQAALASCAAQVDGIRKWNSQ